MISFVLYWYLLLPEHYSEEKEFMYLQFAAMMPGYPIIYLTYQSLFILVISILHLRNFTVYGLLGIQLIYLIILLVARPYKTVRVFNKFIHNLTIIYNQLLTIVVLALVMKWNTLYGNSSQFQSDGETTIYLFLILAMLTIALALAIFRLAIFNKEITVKCCKKQEDEESNTKEAILEADQHTLRKMDRERYGSLMDEKDLRKAEKGRSMLVEEEPREITVMPAR
jgi:hypothetical protein